MLLIEVKTDREKFTDTHYREQTEPTRFDLKKRENVGEYKTKAATTEQLGHSV